MILTPKEINDFKTEKCDSLFLGCLNTIEGRINKMLQFYEGKPIYFSIGSGQLSKNTIREIIAKSSEKGWNVKYIECCKYYSGYFYFDTK